jgi:[acyl-carrier-protein] S-malonyltransferase
MSIGFVFPGQGSQSVGMLRDLAAAHPAVRATFGEASEVLGYDLWTLTQEGPADDLNATERTQPVMLAAGVATWRAWREVGGPEPVVVSGHSLGEFTALVCADTFAFRDALELVRFRGQAMQEAVPLGTGAMAAVLGLEDDAVAAACGEASASGVVEPVNFNAPGQIVIAGEKAAVERAIEIVQARGARRAVMLPVSVPSHSSLMKGAARRFGERLAKVAVKAPRIEYVSAVDAAAHSEPDDIRALLERQLASPVRWTETTRSFLVHRVTAVIECGPGKVLTGLNKQIERRAGQRSNVQYLALEDAAAFTQALEAVKGDAGA